MLASHDRDAFAHLGRMRRYRRGAQLVVQGDRRDTVFVIITGRVKVTLDSGDGREIALSTLGPGDLVGEFEAIEGNGHPRTGGTVALDEVECRAFSADDFRSFLNAHPQAAMVLLRVVIRRLLTADRRRSDSGSVDATQRLCRFLLEQVEAGEHPVGDVIELDVPLTQAELAGVIGSSRESIVRSLSTLRSNGLITTARRRITIRDLGGLQRFANAATATGDPIAGEDGA